MRLILKLAIIFAATSCLQASAQSESALGSKSDLAINVTTVKLSDALVQLQTRVSAEVISLNHTQISAQAVGEVLDIKVEVGEVVEKGAIMVSLDCRLPKLNQASAREALGLARKEYKRAKSLQQSQTIAEQQLNQTQSAQNQARILLNQTDLTVEHCDIKAPFSGVVTQRQVQMGSLANAGAPMLQLLQVDAVEAEVKLSINQLASLKLAQEAYFELPSGMQYPVTLRVVLPLVDKSRHKQTARLQFSKNVPLVGLVGDLTWQELSKRLPVDMIVERRGQLGYFIADKGIARFVALQSATLGHPALVSEADAIDAKLIVEGRFRVEEGRKINENAIEE